jgi:hypothetical protein
LRELDAACRDAEELGAHPEHALVLVLRTVAHAFAEERAVAARA